MNDTAFWLAPHKHHRLTAYYAGSDPMNTLNRDLKRLENHLIRSFPQTDPALLRWWWFGLQHARYDCLDA